MKSSNEERYLSIPAEDISSLNGSFIIFSMSKRELISREISAHSSTDNFPLILSRKTNNFKSLALRNCILTILKPLSKAKASNALKIFFSVLVFATKFSNKDLQKKRAKKPKTKTN